MSSGFVLRRARARHFAILTGKAGAIRRMQEDILATEEATYVTAEHSLGGRRAETVECRVNVR